MLKLKTTKIIFVFLGVVGLALPPVSGRANISGENPRTGRTHNAAEYAPKFSSAYTDTTKDCEGAEPTFTCKGYGNYRIVMGIGGVFADARIESTKSDFSLQIADRQSVGWNPKIEWRMADGKPFAVILRVDINDEHADIPKKEGESLIIKGLQGYENINASVDAKTPMANEKAREIADESLLFLLSKVSAQDEGTRVRFRRGSSSATIKGTVAKGGPDFYLVGARAMQRMTVKVTGKVSFGIDAPNGPMTSDDGNTNWSGELSAYGDYKIRVYSSGGVQNYSLTISIVSVSQNSSSQTSTAESPACRGEQLSLREVEGEADMGGKRYGNYVFTNTSTTPCTLAGYPAFVLLNKKGQILRNVKVKFTNDFVVSGDAEESLESKASKIATLAPGESAWFQIFYNDGMALDHKKPFPVSARVRVTAPHTKRAFLINSEIQACCGVEVSAVRKGSPR